MVNKEQTFKLLLDGKCDHGSLLVLDPINYDMRDLKILYPNFGFCVLSTDKKWYDTLVNNIKDKMEFYTSKLVLHTDLDETAKEIKEFLNSDFDCTDIEDVSKRLDFILNTYILTIICSIYGEISCVKYTAVIDYPGKVGKKETHYFYIGSKNLAPEEVQALCKKKTNHYWDNIKKTSGSKSLEIFLTNIKE